MKVSPNRQTVSEQKSLMMSLLVRHLGDIEHKMKPKLIWPLYQSKDKLNRNLFLRTMETMVKTQVLNASAYNNVKDTFV